MDKHELFEEYAPYHLMAAFKVGFEDYLHSPGLWRSTPHQGVSGQAYDRGLEAGMRWKLLQDRLAAK